MSVIKYPALKVQQGTKTIYTFKANGKSILDFATISRIKRNESGNLEGYQRIAVSKHAKGVLIFVY